MILATGSIFIFGLNRKNMLRHVSDMQLLSNESRVAIVSFNELFGGLSVVSD